MGHRGQSCRAITSSTDDHASLKMLFIRSHDGTIAVSDTAQTRPRWMAMIQLTPDVKLTLVDNKVCSEPFAPSPLKPYNIHILKSNLQKCVRRADRIRGLVTGWQLLCQDSSEMLRRLPIIIAEDALIQLDLFIQLIWLMAATSKGYRLTWMDAAIVMAALSNALNTRERVAIYAEVDETVLFTVICKNPLAFALLVRAEFGGMKHDCDFLRRLAMRATKNDLPIDLEITPDWIEFDIPSLEPSEHILLEAIDQHCCPWIFSEITTINSQALWWCRSSINVRPLSGRGAKEGLDTVTAKQAEYNYIMESARLALNLFAYRQIQSGWISSHTVAVPVAKGPLDIWLIPRKT